MKAPTTVTLASTAPHEVTVGGKTYTVQAMAYANAEGMAIVYEHPTRPFSMGVCAHEGPKFTPKQVAKLVDAYFITATRAVNSGLDLQESLRTLTF